MIAARESHPPAARSATLRLCAALAVAVHGALIFAWKIVPWKSAASPAEGSSVEVALVASAPAAAAVAEPQPPVAQPDPVPPPEPPKREPERILPEPPRTTPPPRTASTAAPSPKAASQPATARRNPAPRSSTAAGTAGGAGTGKIAKATYLIPPVSSYPPESRAAGEHGVVILRLVVDANGRPTSVTVRTGSGFPRLDRAAVEAGWRCRVRDAAPGAPLDAPVRFNLTERSTPAP